jgi:hypothetical protein
MRKIDLIALGIGAALLALGPLALTLARADSYDSTAIVTLNPANPSARFLPHPAKFLADPLTVKDVQHAVNEDVGWFNNARDLPDHVRVESRGDGQFAVIAEGPGTKEAQELADSAAIRLRAAAGTAGAFLQNSQLVDLDKKLKAKDLTAAERKLLRTERATIAASVRKRQDIFAVPTAATLSSERMGDRVLGALPGKRTFRPDPIWVTVAGIALAAALVLWALALGPMRSRSSGSTPG